MRDARRGAAGDDIWYANAPTPTPTPTRTCHHPHAAAHAAVIQWKDYYETAGSPKVYVTECHGIRDGVHEAVFEPTDPAGTVHLRRLAGEGALRRFNQSVDWQLQGDVPVPQFLLDVGWGTDRPDPAELITLDTVDAVPVKRLVAELTRLGVAHSSRSKKIVLANLLRATLLVAKADAEKEAEVRAREEAEAEAEAAALEAEEEDA